MTKPSTFRIWWTAARPHTLTASISPIIVATSRLRHPNYRAVVLWTLFCTTVQLGTNLHNDYADFVQGTDNDKRVGQKRATAQGWWTPRQTCVATCSVLSVTALAGVLLAFETGQETNLFYWFLIGTSLFNAFAYTGGPFPLGWMLGNKSIAYSGLGEFFVLIYFGLVAVCMLPYCLGEAQLPWMEAWQIGLLATNILVVNNIRDRHTDVEANKRTTAVRFGRSFALVEYQMCLGGAYALSLCKWTTITGLRVSASMCLLPLLSIPLALAEIRAVSTKEGSNLNPHVGKAALLQLVFSMLLSLQP